MCGTKVPVFLLLPPGSNIAGWRQQYCWLEPAIEDQPILYREVPFAVPTNSVNCTNIREQAQGVRNDSMFITSHRIVSSSDPSCGFWHRSEDSDRPWACPASRRSIHCCLPTLFHGRRWTRTAMSSRKRKTTSRRVTAM